jgi:hypothetical protein
LLLKFNKVGNLILRAYAFCDPPLVCVRDHYLLLLSNHLCFVSDKKKPHIKKPLNAFMLYMKEMRAKVVAECTLKESAAINQILGRRVSGAQKVQQSVLDPILLNPSIAPLFVNCSLWWYIAGGSK